MNKKSFIEFILFCIASHLMLTSCASNDKKYVLQIDGFNLSPEGFNSSYKIAPEILKFGADPQINYLTAIKNEFIVSQHLIENGYGQDSSLSKTLRLFKQELIVEKMFDEDVDSKIQISNEEILAEIRKGNKQVKVKYIYSKDFTTVEKFKTRINLGDSFEEVQELGLSNIGISSSAGETDYLNYGEIDQQINEVLFTLVPGKVSEIIQTEVGYFILKVVDVRKSILSESDIQRLIPTYKKVLLNKKMNSEAREYIKSFMDPLKIVVNGKEFQSLVNNLYPEYKRERKTNSITLQSNQEFLRIEDYKNKLDNELLGKSLVKFKGGSISVSEMLYHFSYYPVSFSTTSIDDFAAEFKKKIGLRLRDIFLEKEGIKRNYDKIEIINEELELWQNQIIIYRYLQKLSSEIILDTVEIEEKYDEEFQSSKPFSEVEQKIVSSYKDYIVYKKLTSIVETETPKYEIEIETDLLKIDNDYPFRKLPGVDIFTYKMGLPYSRLAFAVPNRIWAAKNIWQSLNKY